MLPLEIAPAAVKEMLDAGDDIRLIDCREAHEYALSRIEGAELMPMNTIPSRLTTLDAMADHALVVVHCHHGVRSMNVVAWLRQQGVDNCQSMAGGIDLWSATVDPNVPRY